MNRRVSPLQAAVSCCLLSGLGWGPLARSDVGQTCPAPKKCALLVGCSDYQDPSITDLWAPANDVQIWSDVLVGHFGFDGARVRRLAGWPADPKGRPTRDNIAREIDELTSGAGPGDQIFLLLSGHGVRIRDTRRGGWAGGPEERGLVGAFLPADVSLRAGVTVDDVVTHAEIARWLARARQRGAHVLGVFDCCESSGLIRENADVGVRPRLTQRGAPGHVGRACDRCPDRGEIDEGTVVAIYACDRGEEAVELPRPIGADHGRENYHSLLSYHLTCTLAQSKTPLSYGKLMENVTDRYHAERGSRPPTASAEGDLEGNVLGMTHRSPPPAIVLSRTAGGKLRINAGEIGGLSPRSMLVVFPPGIAHERRMGVLGYVKVGRLSATSAEVRPAARRLGGPEVEPGCLPDGAICEVLER